MCVRACVCAYTFEMHAPKCLSPVADSPWNVHRCVVCRTGIRSVQHEELLLDAMREYSDDFDLQVHHTNAGIDRHRHR